MSNPGDEASLASKTRRLGGVHVDIASAAIIVLGTACFVVLFFGWNSLCLPSGGRSVCRTEFGVVSGWAAFGVVAGLAVVCLVLWEVLALAGALAVDDHVEPQVAAGLAIALVAFTLLRVLTHLSGLTAFAWLGLALAVAVCAVAVVRWLRYRRAEPPAIS